MGCSAVVEIWENQTSEMNTNSLKFCSGVSNGKNERLLLHKYKALSCPQKKKEKEYLRFLCLVYVVVCSNNKCLFKSSFSPI